MEGKAAITFTCNEKPDIVAYLTLEEVLKCTDVYDILDHLKPPCNQSSCNNESQNFCDCGGMFDDYEYSKIEFVPQKKGDR